MVVRLRERMFKTRERAFSCALLGVALLGVPDYLIGTDVSISIFYLIPVGVATWYAGRSPGLITAVLSTFVAFAAELSDGYFSTHPSILAWNALVHIATMVVVAQLLERLHVHVRAERRLARVDPLTAIHNRRAFDELLRFGLDLAARNGTQASLAYIDVDNFKQVNDRCGHDEGDRILRLVASTLSGCVRRTDVAARLGGDEFAVFMPGTDGLSARRLVGKIGHAFEQAFAGETTSLSCSVGCVSFQRTIPSPEEALAAADRLMYQIKSAGKNGQAFDVWR
jgi:diguanylate cyclase (GGDEF)-like protein